MNIIKHTHTQSTSSIIQVKELYRTGKCHNFLRTVKMMMPPPLLVATAEKLDNQSLLHVATYAATNARQICFCNKSPNKQNKW